MIVYLQNIKISVLLLMFTSMMQSQASCSKSNKKQMVVQQTDSVPAVTIIKDTVTRNYLALGDSYTIGESIPVTESYPYQTTALLNNEGFNFLSPKIIATSGWTTVNLINAIAAETDLLPSYDIVTLLIGVNNQYQGGSQADYKTGFTTLLQYSIAYAGNSPSHVIVISIPDYSGTPFALGRNDNALIASQIDSFNAINKQISANYNVNYINVTDDSREAFTDKSLLASDGLHYSAAEYAIWSALIASTIKNILK
jgi:lysophospholipase L1-like esterase